MQTKTARGVRHLLVSTGVISLVLSVAAPAALADKPAHAGGRGNGPSGEADRAGGGAAKVWVCHRPPSETNPWVLIEVSENAGGHLDNHSDVQIDEADVRNALGVGPTDPLGAQPAAKLTPEQQAAVDDVCDVANATLPVVPVPVEPGNELNPAPVVPAPVEPGNELDPPPVVPVPGNGVITPPGHGGEIPGTGELTPPFRGDAPGQTPPPAQEIAPVTEGEATPVITPAAPGTGTPAQGNPGAPTASPATPVQPIPAVQRRPVVVISDDAVTRPVTPAVPASPTVMPATPASPAAAPAVAPVGRNEVLGAVTTRTPSGASSVDASAQVAGSVTVLAATGTSTTWVLVTIGLALLLTGLGLQVSARRRVRSADVGA